MEGELAAFPGVSGVTAEQVVEAQTSADTVQLYDLGFDAAWELDLFGGQARALEGARAGIEAGEASVQDTEVSLTAEVAAAYVELRSLQQQLRLSLRTVQLEAQALTLGRQRFSGGIASDLDTERLNNQLQTTRALVAPIKAAISEQLDRIAVLLGRTPGSLDGILNSPGSVPLPPSTVAVGDAAALLRRRPDIRAAERRIQQQNASVGQHIAEFFPKVTLLGSIGFSGLDVGKTVIGDGASYAIAPGLQWTLFDFGRVGAEVAQARANSDEARAEYRETVLNALKEAETSLSRYANQRESLDELMRVQSSTDRSLALTKLRVKGGTATSLDLVEAESRRVQAAVNLAQASARLTQDYIALHKSLGLGWSPVT